MQITWIHGAAFVWKTTHRHQMRFGLSLMRATPVLKILLIWILVKIEFAFYESRKQTVKMGLFVDEFLAKWLLSRLIRDYRLKEHIKMPLTYLNRWKEWQLFWKFGAIITRKQPWNKKHFDRIDWNGNCWHFSKS